MIVYNSAVIFVAKMILVFYNKEVQSTLKNRGREETLLQLLNKYEIQKVLSNNEDSSVYLVKHHKLQNLRVIKQIHKSSVNYSILSKEAQILSNISHPFIPQLHDIEEDHEAMYLIESYIDGEVLSSFCKHVKLSEKMIIQLVMQVCDILHYLHTKEVPLLYLDLKPENLIIHKEQIYMVDFGSARNLKEEKHLPYGTLWFSAPEQFFQRKLQKEADIYGIGMLLYYMVLGENYYQDRGNSIDHNTCCSNKLKRIINRCLKWNYLQRYHGVLELKNALNRCISLCEGEQKEKPVILSFVGSKRGIGTTYAALQFAVYLNRQGVSCLYVECNDFRVLPHLLRENPEIYCDEGYKIHKTPCESMCLEEFMESDIKYRNYAYIILDLGMYGRGNRSEFLNADVSIAVVGGRAWEHDAIREIHEQGGEEQNIWYLYNFVSLSEFQKIRNILPSKYSYRIPVEPQWFQLGAKETLFIFYQVLFGDIKSYALV